MIRVQNTDRGPRGIFAGGEMVTLQPGEARDLDVAAADLRAAQVSKWFSLEGETKEEPRAVSGRRGVDLAALSDDELRSFLKDRGIATDGRWGRERLLSEAEKVQG